MMANMNSPLLARVSPFARADTPERERSDSFSIQRGDEYQLEKDLVIGELASRMKRTPVSKAGFDKNKRGDADIDDDLDNYAVRKSRDFSPFSRDEPVQIAESTPAESSYTSVRDTARPVEQVVAKSAINPQRTATAAIKLAPSPTVERKLETRDRSKSPVNKKNMSRLTTTQSKYNGHASSTSSKINLSSSRTTTTPALSRPAPNRSISLQATSTARKPNLPNGNSSRRVINSSASSSVRGSNSSLASSANSGSSRSLAPPTSLNRSISSDPNMNDPAILAKIGNRATKTVQRSIGKCGACNKTINEDGCTAFGRVYHKACFKCTVCRQKIQGKFFQKDGKPYCQKDFMKIQESCTVCGQPIKGDSVVSNNKAFHPECMKCYICGDSLRGQYFTYQDQPICERDYKQYADKCHGCDEAVTGKFYKLNEVTFCEDCHVNQAEQCLKCNEDILDGKMVKIQSGSYHPECFKCVVCKKNMGHHAFITDNKNNIYCPEDYKNKKAPKCSFCKKPIVPKEDQKTAPRLRAMGRDFHPKCFQCEDCGLVLDSKVKERQCYPYKNHILCYKCNRKKLSSSESDDSSSDNEE